MFTRLHNEIDAKESYAHYRCDIVNDTDHNRKTGHDWQRIYDNTIVWQNIYFHYDIFMIFL